MPHGGKYEESVVTMPDTEAKIGVLLMQVMDDENFISSIITYIIENSMLAWNVAFV